jgi:transcriptional regulator of arginine metabolism
MPTDAEVRRQRRQVLSELIRQGNVHSQADLVEGLRQRGFSVTQSSVSRDLRDLRVGKVAGRYVLPATFLAVQDIARNGEEVPGEISRWVRSVRAAGPHLLVVKTAQGSAMQVATNLDHMNWTDIVGTVAGDDTIFIATEGKAAQSRVARRLFETHRIEHEVEHKVG